MFEYGRGAEAAVLDLTQGIRYFSGQSEKLVQEFGGNQYYTSCSGISGAGWINGHPRLIEANCYRADRRGWDVNDTNGIAVVVPYWYKDDNNAGMPAFVRKGDTWWACKVPEVLECLKAETPTGEFEFKWNVTRNLKEMEEVTLKIPFVGDLDRRDVYRGAMRSVAISHLQCRPLLVKSSRRGRGQEEDRVQSSSEFYRRLGFDLVTSVTGRKVFIGTLVPSEFNHIIVLRMWDGEGRVQIPGVEWIDDDTHLTRNGRFATLSVRRVIGEKEQSSEVEVDDSVLVRYYSGEKDALNPALAEVQAGFGSVA